MEETCGGEGVFITDTFNPASDYGHDQIEVPCEGCSDCSDEE